MKAVVFIHHPCKFSNSDLTSIFPYLKRLGIRFTTVRGYSLRLLCRMDLFGFIQGYQIIDTNLILISANTAIFILNLGS